MNVVGNLAVILSANGAPLMTALSRAQGALSKFGAEASNFAAITLGSIGLTSSLGQLAAQALITGVQTAASFEQSQIAFETMIGSATKAKGLLAGIRKMAAQTPFQTTDLVKASQQLLIYGVEAERILPVLTRLGDLASAAPQGAAEGMAAIIRALGQMRQAGKVNAQDMLQLTNAGVPAWKALADAAGVSIAKIRQQVEAGQVDAKAGWNAVMALAASPKFAGMMAKQSQTMAGLWSTMKDNAVLALEGIGQVLATTFKPAMMDANKEVEKFGTLFDSASRFVEYFLVGWESIKLVVRQVGVLMMGAVSAMYKLNSALVDGVATALDAMSNMPGMGDLAGIASKFRGSAAEDAETSRALREGGRQVWDENAKVWRDATDKIMVDFDAARQKNKNAASELEKFAKTTGKAEEALAKLAEADRKRGEDIRAEMNPFEKWEKDVMQIQRLREAGEINALQENMAIADAFKAVEDFANIPEPKLSGALRVGSAEAVSALNQDLLRNTAGKPEDRVVKIMEAVKKKIEAQTTAAEEVARVVKERGIGVLKDD